MRNVITAAAISLILAACGGPTLQETATSVPKRDLTLTGATGPTLQVASGIELAMVRTTHRSRGARVAAPVRVAREPEAPVVRPAPTPQPVVLPESAPTPAAVEAPQPDLNGRELAPGATVTLIPVSAGPSSGGAGGGGGWSEVPAPRGHGGVTIGGGVGGHCGGGRGRGPVSILR